MSDSVWPLGLQHTRLSCPSLYPGVCSNSRPLNQWYHPTISSSDVPFSSCPQSFLESGSFPKSQLFASGGQSFGASASSVLQMNVQDWYPLGLTGLISAVQATLKSLLQHHSSKASVLQYLAFLMAQDSYLYMTIRKTIALTIWMICLKNIFLSTTHNFPLQVV